MTLKSEIFKWKKQISVSIIDVDTNCNWSTRYSHQRIVKETGRLGKKMASEDYQNCCVFKISQKTEKSPGSLKRLAVTQNPVKDHQLTLAWKTLKGWKKKIIHWASNIRSIRYCQKKKKGGTEKHINKIAGSHSQCKKKCVLVEVLGEHYQRDWKISPNRCSKKHEYVEYINFCLFTS